VCGICHGSVSVCVSVSLTSRNSTKMAKHRNMQTTPYDRPGTLVSDAKNLFEIPTGSSPMGVPNAGGVGRSWQLLTNNLLHLYLGRQTRTSY